MSASFATLLAPEATFSFSTPFGTTPLPVTNASQPLATNDPNFIEQEHIRKVIRAYFDLRHKSFSILRLESFDGLLSRSPKAIAFWERESSKLRVQLKYAGLSGGRFVKYEYFLSDEKIFIDSASQAATVFVSLRHNVIYEISALLTLREPVVSRSLVRIMSLDYKKRMESGKYSRIRTMIIYGAYPEIPGHPSMIDCGDSRHNRGQPHLVSSVFRSQCPFQ
jgi:hypothetical protein